MIDHIPRDSLYNNVYVKNLIKSHLQIILEYAQNFNLILSEHTAVDCSFLELIPTLYKDIENQVTLHALCDPVLSVSKKSRSGTPPIVHCAGAAVIRIKVIYLLIYLLFTYFNIFNVMKKFFCRF